MLSSIDDTSIIPTEGKLDDKKKRVLWLINHPTLKEFEVPLLISLGFEVYTSKQIPYSTDRGNGSLEQQDDHRLSIPQDDLEQLNEHDFYDKPLTRPIANILNRYFGSAFCVFSPPLLKNLVNNFDGDILLRALGLDKSTSYGRQLALSLGRHFLDRLGALGNRFWFSQAYLSLDEIEPEILRSRSVFHPLWLSDNFFNNKNTWVGRENKILFFCPRIATSPSHDREIHGIFRKHLGDLPHCIADDQEDPTAIGYQARATIKDLLKTCNVMFCPSQGPKHLHYPLLEALVVGTPLIYLRGGLLEQLAGTHQPGACISYEEAREKIKRIFSRDKKFIEALQLAQRNILKHFTFEFAKSEWEKNFLAKVIKKTSAENAPHAKTRTIGVFLPTPYQGGTLNAAKSIAKMLHLGSLNVNEPVKVIFSCVANQYNIELDFQDLKELGIPVRETYWYHYTAAEITHAMEFAGQIKPLKYPTYVFPLDGISHFTDCDFFLFISDRITSPLAPLKPYALVVHDYIQRYVPEIMSHDALGLYDNFIINAREAEFVLTTTPATAEDAIQYAGLAAHQVHVAPMEFEPLIENNHSLHSALKRPYFIWTTNITPHKNHERAIAALHIYYSELEGQFDVAITGSHTDLMSPSKQIPCDNSHAQYVRALIEKHAYLNKHLHFLGNLSKQAFVNVMRQAKFLWHPTLIDNGTYAVVEAAYLGVPSLSSHYPQMDFINERFHLNLCFFDSHSARDMALKLKLMEEQYLLRAKNLPEKSFFDQFSCKNQASAFWRIVRSII